MASSRKLRAFKKWMTRQGIECSDALDLVESSSFSVSVRALCDLHLGDVVATIPKESCLTIKTSAARQIIDEAQLDGYLALAFAVMYERSLGPLSPWFGYLNLLPFSEPIPLLWSVSEIDSLLAGTEIHKIVKDDKAIVYEDWKECIEPLLCSEYLEIKPEYFGVEEYFAAKSLIASRSFEIDEYHGSGMVPLADLFNHKTGAEDVHFTLASESNDNEDADFDKSEYNNNGPSDLESSHSELVDDGAVNEPTEAHSSDESVSGDDLTVLEMIMVKEVKAKAEVFNTYGISGNAALLHRYGFADPDNQYDIVNLDLELVLEWSSLRFSHRYTRRRLSLWRKLDYSGCISQDSEYFEISFDGEPQVDLLVLLYIILLAEEVFTKLDLAVSVKGDFEQSKLLKKDDILFGEGLELSNSVLLTEGVRVSLLALADIRESLYGSNCLEDDIKAWNRCSLVKEPKIYYSLVLRISEKRILEKLRCYASSSAMMQQKEGSKTRKRAKVA